MSTVYIYCMDCLRMEAEAPAVTLSAHVRLLSRTAVNSPTCIACSLYLQGGEKRKSGQVRERQREVLRTDEERQGCTTLRERQGCRQKKAGLFTTLRP